MKIDIANYECSINLSLEDIKGIAENYLKEVDYMYSDNLHHKFQIKNFHIEDLIKFSNAVGFQEASKITKNNNSNIPEKCLIFFSDKSDELAFITEDLTQIEFESLLFRIGLSGKRLMNQFLKYNKSKS